MKFNEAKITSAFDGIKLKGNMNHKGNSKEIGFEARGKFKGRNATLYTVINEFNGTVSVTHYHRFDGAFIIDIHDSYEVKGTFWEVVAQEGKKIEAFNRGEALAA